MAELNFTKRAIEALPVPATGTRAIYRDAKQQYLRLRVTPGARTYYFEKKHQGRKHRVTLGQFPAMAPEKARKECAKVASLYAEGVAVADRASSERGELTFGELWEDFKVNRPRKSTGVDGKTYKDQWDIYLSRWRKYRLSEISFQIARRFILKVRKRELRQKNAKDEMQEYGGVVVANRVQRQAKAMFNHAIKELNWQGQNPFTFSQASEQGRGRQSRITAKQMPAIVRELNKLQGKSASSRELLWFLLLVGRSRGVSQVARWVDLDLDGKVWLAKTRAKGAGSTASAEEVSLPTMEVERLKTWREELLAKHDGRLPMWVFPGRNPAQHIINPTRAWKTVCKAAKVKEVTMHDLRRTLSSFAQEAKVPVSMVAAQLGHADSKTTSKHYTAIEIDVQQLAMDAAVTTMLGEKNGEA